MLDRDYRRLHGTRDARRELLHIRNSRLFTPRDFDISPYFRIVKPMIESGFDPHHLRWATLAPGDLQPSAASVEAPR